MTLLTDKTTLASPDDLDVLHVVDTSDTSSNAAGTSKKITLEKIKEHMFDGVNDFSDSEKTKLESVEVGTYPIVKPTLNLNFAAMKSLDPRIEFTRDSKASYVNEKGLLAYAGENEPCFDHDPVTGECKGLAIWEARANLYDFSEDFTSSQWGKGGTTSILSNTELAPDGTNTATLIEGASDTLTNTLQRTVSVTVGELYTATVYVKLGTATRMALRLRTTDGSSSEINYFSSDYEDVGNGWRRVFVTVTPTTSSLRVYIGYLNGTAYIWGAQLEKGAFPTPYIPSVQAFTSRASIGTYFGSDGLLQTATTDEARWNYNPLDLSIPPKLLLEDASENLAPYSSALTSWNNSSSVSASAVIAPDGSSDAEANTDPASSVVPNVSVDLPAAMVTVSAFVHTSSTADWLRLRIETSASSSSAWLSMTTLSWGGYHSGFSGGIFQAVGNGWYRISIQYTPAPGNEGTRGLTSLAPVAANNGSTVDTGKTVITWGTQLEEGQLSSYIPTTTAAVTRAADVSTSVGGEREADLAEMTGANFSDWYRQDEGSIFVGSQVEQVNSSFNRVFEVGDGTSSNTLGALQNFYTSSVNIPYANIKFEGVSQSTVGSVVTGNTITLGETSLVGISYKTDDINIAVDAGGVTTDSTASIPSVDRLLIGSNAALADDFLNGHISSFTFYPKALTDNELQIITQP